jgi:hypothetical protein
MIGGKREIYSTLYAVGFCGLWFDASRHTFVVTEYANEVCF